MAELIADPREFVSLQMQGRSVFDLEKRLPSQVFQRKCRYYACEYPLIFDKAFSLFLSSIASQFKDQTVHYMTLDPSPDYYCKHYGHFGLASFDPKILQTRYMDVMTRNDPGSFRSHVNIGAFWGSSLSWGIMCDRISWELCIIGIAGGSKLSICSNFPLMKLNDVNRYVAAAYHWKPAVASDFSREFSENYLSDRQERTP